MARATVITSTFKHARYLPAMVEAVVTQSRPPDEFLIADDASPDESWEILQKLAAQHPLLQIARNEQNLGVIGSQNSRMRASTGDYVLCSASDDRLLPGAVEAVMRVAERYPQAGLACGRAVWWNEPNDDQFESGLAMPDHECFLSPADCLALARRGCLDLGGHCAFYRRDALFEFGLYREELGWHHDWFLAYAIAFRHGIAWTPHRIAVMRLSDVGYSAPGKQRLEERKTVYRAMADLLLQPAFDDIGTAFSESGLLAYYGRPMLSVVWEKPRRALLSRAFLWAQLRAALRQLTFLRTLIRRLRPVAKRTAHTDLDLSAMG